MLKPVVSNSVIPQRLKTTESQVEVAFFAHQQEIALNWHRSEDLWLETTGLPILNVITYMLGLRTTI